MGEAITEAINPRLPMRRHRLFGERLWLSRRLLGWSVRVCALFFALAGIIMAASRIDRSACLRILGVDDANVRSLMGYRSLIADVDAGRIALESRFPPRREFAYLPVLGRALYTTDDGRFPPAYALILQGASGIFSDDYVLQTRMVDAFDSEDPTDNYKRFLIDSANRTIAYLWRSPEGLSSGGFNADKLSVSDTATGQTRTVDLGSATLVTYLHAISDDGAFITIRRTDTQQTLMVWSLQTLQPITDAPNFITGAWVPGQPIFTGVALEPEGRAIVTWSPVNGVIAKRVIPLGEPVGLAAADWKTLPAPDGQAFALQRIEPVCAGSYCPNSHFVFDIYSVSGDIIAQGLRGDTLRQTTGSATNAPPSTAPTLSPSLAYRRSATWSADGRTFYYVSTPEPSGTPPTTGTLIAFSVSTGKSVGVATDILSGLSDTIFFPTTASRYYSANAIQSAAAHPRIVIPVARPNGRIAVDIMNLDGTDRTRLLEDVDSVDTLRNPFHYYFEGLGWSADGHTIILPWWTMPNPPPLPKPAGSPASAAGVSWVDIDGTNRHMIDGLNNIDLVNLAIDQTTRRASRYFGLIEAIDRTRSDYRFELVNVDTARRYPVTLPSGLRPRDWVTWFAPGGKYAAVVFDGNSRSAQSAQMVVINLETGDSQRIDGGYIGAWSQDGTRLAVGRQDELARQVIDVLPIGDSGSQRRLIPDTLSEIRTLSWNPCR